MRQTPNSTILTHGRAMMIAAVVGLSGFLGSAKTGLAQEIGQVESIDSLIARCAPTVHPETMSAIVGVESRGHLYAIADAGPVHLPWSQRKSMVRSFYMGSAEEAVAKAKSLIAAGHTVSLGLSQVNDRNLRSLGLSLETVFDPCTNVSAGGVIMTNFYQRAVQRFGEGERALRAALSAYNSGDWLRGERDGYVNLVYKQAGRPLALRTSARVPRIPQDGAPVVRSVTTPAARIAPGKREFAMTGTVFAAE